MENKIIDLRNCKEDITIIFPRGATAEGSSYIDNNHKLCINELNIKINKNPFDLVPKSWEEFCINNPSKCDIVCLGFKEELSFRALIKLRLLWSEWVKILGEPKKTNYSIRNSSEKGIIVCQNTILTNILSFKEKSHAEEFLKCFDDLLNRAKTLL